MTADLSSSVPPNDTADAIDALRREKIALRNELNEAWARVSALTDADKAGWDRAIEKVAVLAKQWAAENELSRIKAANRGDDILAEELRGARIEADAFAAAITTLPYTPPSSNTGQTPSLEQGK